MNQIAKKIPLKQFEDEIKRLESEIDDSKIENRAKSDEIDRIASFFIPFLAAIFFTAAIFFLKFVVN